MGANDLPRRIPGATLTPDRVDAVAPVPTDVQVERARLLAVAEECELGDNADMARICREAAYDIPTDADLDDLDARVPYVLVEPIATVPGFVRHTNEPCDLRPRFSSQAGAASHRYSPTRFGTPPRTFGYNLVTIDPQGNHSGPRLDGTVTREEALAELDELAPFMVDGYTSVLVELREVTR